MYVQVNQILRKYCKGFTPKQTLYVLEGAPRARSDIFGLYDYEVLLFRRIESTSKPYKYNIILFDSEEDVAQLVARAKFNFKA